MVRKTRPLVIAVDAMGGDHGPEVIVPGAVDAVRESDDLAVALYGDPDAIDAAMLGLEADGLPIAVVPCTETITMAEPPAAAVRHKQDSSIVRAMQDHREGRVHAVVSAGSTGAMAAAGLLILGRLPGVERPAIGTVIPTLADPFLLLDAGANVQATPQHLLVFGRMGDLYARLVLEIPRPRLALLNIGEEASKGNELTVAAHALLRERSDLYFVGNIEGRDLLFGKADVVVTDGFTGNVVLKLIEGFGAFLQQAAAGAHSQGGGQRELLERMDYAAYGGALMLGVRGNPVIAHGTSSRRAIGSAVRAAGRLARLDVPNKLAALLAETDKEG